METKIENIEEKKLGMKNIIFIENYFNMINYYLKYEKTIKKIYLSFLQFN